jgi:hypothetical protein
MSAVPSASEILRAVVASLPGRLILAGVAVGVLVFLVPLFFAEPEDPRVTARRGAFVDWGVSIACVLIGAGAFLVETSDFGLGHSYSYDPQYRYGISLFFFAIAGRSVYTGCKPRRY